MGWRFRWLIIIESDHGPEGERSRLLRWAVLGLAVLGAAAVLIYRAAS